jgi:hypothetical protein
MKAKDMKTKVQQFCKTEVGLFKSLYKFCRLTNQPIYDSGFYYPYIR